MNRIDEIIIFEPLTLAQVEHIVDLQMGEIAERLSSMGLQVHLTEPARNWLARKGYDPQFGARPLRRALQRYVENELSQLLLRGDIRRDDAIVIDEVDGKLTFALKEEIVADFRHIPQDQDTLVE